MKSFFYFLYIFVFLLKPAASAAIGNEKFIYTLKAGLSISNMTQYGIEGSNFKNLYGYHINFSTEYSLGKNNCIEMGIFLTTKGYQFQKTRDIPLNGILRNATENIQFLTFYLDFPLMYKRWFQIKGINLYACIGVYYGVGFFGVRSIETRIENTLNNTGEQNLFGLSSPNTFYRSDAGAIVGVGLLIKKHFLISSHFSNGLISVTKDKTYNAKHYVLSISLGYIFSFSKKTNEAKKK